MQIRPIPFIDVFCRHSNLANELCFWDAHCIWFTQRFRLNEIMRSVRCILSSVRLSPILSYCWICDTNTSANCKWTPVRLERWYNILRLTVSNDEINKWKEVRRKNDDIFIMLHTNLPSRRAQNAHTHTSTWTTIYLLYSKEIPHRATYWLQWQLVMAIEDANKFCHKWAMLIAYTLQICASCQFTNKSHFLLSYLSINAYIHTWSEEATEEEEEKNIRCHAGLMCMGAREWNEMETGIKYVFLWRTKKTMANTK